MISRPCGLFTMLVAAMLLAACVTAPTRFSDPPASPELTFEQHEVVTGFAERQTVLTGHFLEGPVADLALLNLDENDEARLRIYAFGDGTWAPALEQTLGTEVLFVDVANLGGSDRLVSYVPGRLNWFDPETTTVRALVETTASFSPPRAEVHHVDITRDLNDDGLDDLVVPEADGFQVFIQMSDGVFASPLKIGSSAEMGRIYGADGYRYDPWSQSRVHQIDHNRDGRSDLVFWNADHFEVHTQDEGGLFAAVAETFTTDVVFDSDQISSLAEGDMTGRVLHSLADLNDDGVGDLVVLSLEGRSISSKQSTYEVHFGAPGPDGGTVFGRGVDIAFQSDERIQLGMDPVDFDRDGDVDLMLTTIDIDFLESSLWKRLKGFMGDDVWLDLEFYLMEGGRYPATPDAIRRVALDGEPSGREPGWVPLDIVLRGGTDERRDTQGPWRRAFNRPLLIGDVTGDDRQDLLIGRTPEGLEVLVGVPGPDLFARPSQSVGVPLPADGEYTWLVDLNRDGKQDVLLHHASTTQPHRVTILLAP